MIGFFHLALLDDIEMEIPLSEHLPENIIVELKQISAWLLSCKSDTVFLQDYVTIRSGLLLKSLNAYVCYILKHAGYCFLLLYVFYFFYYIYHWNRQKFYSFFGISNFNILKFRFYRTMVNRPATIN